MDAMNRALWLPGLAMLLVFALAGLAGAVDTDGDGVDDANDLCPGSDPNVELVDPCGCPLPPACGDPWHPLPGADIDGDCYVDANDVVVMTQQWLDCTHPLDATCTQLHPSPEEMYPDLMGHKLSYQG